MASLRLNHYLALFVFSQFLLCGVNAGDNNNNNNNNNNVLQTKVSEDGARRSEAARLYLSLKHRDAPNSPFLEPRYKSRQELLQIVLERDEVRAQVFREQRRRPWPWQATGVAMADASPPDPTGEGIPWLWPPAGAGEYYTELYVGMPRQLQVVMVDLASNLVWLGKSKIPVKNSHFFDPSSSSSFTPIPSACKEGLHVQGQVYQDNDSLEFAYEDVQLNRTAQHTMRKILMGVSQVQVPTGGVLGLGQGRTSFATQVATTFAYCLADTDEPSGSSLVFDPDVRDARLVFTPLYSAPPGNVIRSQKNLRRQLGFKKKITEKPLLVRFDTVSLVGIAVNGEVMASRERAIIDMSTRFTRLPRCAFYRVVNAVKVKMGLRTTKVPGFHLCYRLVNTAQLRRVPTVAFVFESGARMALPMENLFVSATERGDVMCLAMVPGRPGTAAVIGSTQQQNFLMLLDRHRARFGFAPRQCAAFPKL